MKRYDHKKIEKKWQKEWARKKLYHTPDKKPGAKNFYLLTEFPYPSGNLHVGHWYAFSVPDILVRALRMQKNNVLFPIGFDAFGLPAENAAIKRKLNPRTWTYDNMRFMRKQLESMGASFDWSREVVTCDPEYYKWTQYLFLQLYKQGLAYQANRTVNWCPSCKTVLANEQVTAGRCERCDTAVTQKEMLQWNIRITDYADRLIDDLEPLEWPEQIKDSQRNWIGRSEGASIKFQIANSKLQIEVFTTRPDTLYGATYVVLAPEHELVGQLKSEIKNWPEAKNYIDKVKNIAEIERAAEGKEKTGVKLEGVMAINPANGEEIPIYIADYVLATYGTGAVMAVPAHDNRDWEFAKKFNLPIKQVIAPESGQKRANEIRRDGGCGVVFDPVTQKYAVSQTPDGIMRLFGGGIDEGEELEQGVIREINEESGLHGFSYLENVYTYYTHYYNILKKVNRSALASCFLVILNHTNQKDRKLEGHEQEMDVIWVSAEELLANWKKLTPDLQPYHWFESLNHAVARAIELGYDKTSDPQKFISTAFTGAGILINSGGFDGQENEVAKKVITEHVGGRLVTKYKLRDWVVSRQRYWGVPIPIIHCASCGNVPVPDKDLPVKLPNISDYLPRDDGKSPLAKAKTWIRVRCPKCKEWAERETDTLDTFVDSSWYFLRYTDPNNKKEFASKTKMRPWLPVNLYSGGSEHTTMHLLYSRFWHKALYDLKLVTDKEPYLRRMNRGLILGPDNQKMSKSRGNVIDPDRVVADLGADTVRMYLAFIGPYSETGSYPWNPDGVVGIRRFLERVWRLQDKVVSKSDADIEIQIHQMIKKVGDDIAALKFNTAIAQMMITLNSVEKRGVIGRKQFETFLRLLAPFAPHLTEELWYTIGHQRSIHLESWPKHDPGKLSADKIKVVVQVSGKTRDTVELARDLSEKEVLATVLEMPTVQKWVADTVPKKVIYVQNRLINIVI